MTFAKIDKFGNDNKQTQDSRIANPVLGTSDFVRAILSMDVVLVPLVQHISSLFPSQ